MRLVATLPSPVLFGDVLLFEARRRGEPVEFGFRSLSGNRSPVVEWQPFSLLVFRWGIPR